MIRVPRSLAFPSVPLFVRERRCGAVPRSYIGERPQRSLRVHRMPFPFLDCASRRFSTVRCTAGVCPAQLRRRATPLPPYAEAKKEPHTHRLVAVAVRERHGGTPGASRAGRLITGQLRIATAEKRTVAGSKRGPRTSDSAHISTATTSFVEFGHTAYETDARRQYVSSRRLEEVASQAEGGFMARSRVQLPDGRLVHVRTAADGSARAHEFATGELALVVAQLRDPNPRIVKAAVRAVLRRAAKVDERTGV